MLDLPRSTMKKLPTSQLSTKNTAIAFRTARVGTYDCLVFAKLNGEIPPGDTNFHLLAIPAMYHKHFCNVK